MLQISTLVAIFVHTLSIPMLLELLHYFLQSETDARFAEVQQQLVQKDTEIRDLRVRIYRNNIEALIDARTLKCCTLVGAQWSIRCRIGRLMFEYLKFSSKQSSAWEKIF